MMDSVLASCGNEMEKDSRQKFCCLSGFLSEHCQRPVEWLAGAELNVPCGAGTLSTFQATAGYYTQMG